MLDVRWEPIDGYPNYVVSDQGDILNLTTDLLLKTRPNQEGYLRVALYNEGVSREHYVAQIVARAFFGAFKEGMRITQVNGDKEDNRLCNLRLLAGKVKVDHRSRREGWGEQIMIVETGQIFRTVRDCARHIGGDYGSIYRCLRGERQTHLGLSFAYHKVEEEIDDESNIQQRNG